MTDNTRDCQRDEPGPDHEHKRWIKLGPHPSGRRYPAMEPSQHRPENPPHGSSEPKKNGPQPPSTG